MQFHWEMSEVALFWDMMSQNSHSQSDAQMSKMCRSHFELRHQVASTTTSTSFLTPLPLHGHSLPPSSALANAHKWANPGQAHWHQQSHAPPHRHLSAAAPMLPAPATTWKTTTTRWEGWRRVTRVGRRGKGDREGDDNAVCNPHATSSISFPLCCLMTWCATHTLHHLFYSLHVVWWCGMQPTHHIIYFFLSP